MAYKDLVQKPTKTRYIIDKLFKGYRSKSLLSNQ